MDEVVEIFRNENDPEKEPRKRELGLIIIRGPNVNKIFFFLTIFY